MSDFVSVIVKLKQLPDPFTHDDILEQLRLSAILCQETFGKGGNPYATIIEDYIGATNSPESGPFVRCKIDKTFGQALEYIESIGGNPLIGIVKVEWYGQEMFQTGIDDDGNPVNLGVIGSLPMYHEPIIEEEV